MFVPLPETLSRTKLLGLVEAKNSLQVQITELSTSKSSSSEEVENLKHRVDDTEREKRDLVGVISRLKQETSQREGESWFLFLSRFLQILRGDTNSSRKSQGGPSRTPGFGGSSSGVTIHRDVHQGSVLDSFWTSDFSQCP